MHTQHLSRPLLPRILAIGLLLGLLSVLRAPDARAQGFADWLKRDREQMRQFKDGQPATVTNAPAVKVRAPAPTPAPTPSPTNDWLIMVYQAADNNLDPYSILDLKEMQQFGMGDRVRVTVMNDRGEGGDWQSARRFLIRRPKDQGGKQSWDPVLSTCEDLGEVNMGKPETLRDFITWSLQKYPARHTMLVLWNHGGGWRDARGGAQNPLSRGIAWDDTDGGDFLETREVRAVLEAFPKLSILAADACLMAMLEVAYEWREHADFLIASEDIEPGDGWPYDTALAPLADNPGLAPEALARHIAKSYDTSYARQATTISVIRMERVAELARAVDGWASARLAASALGGDDFFKVPGYPQGATEFYDLGALLDRDAGDSAATAAIRQSARAARQALTAAVLVNHSAPQLGGTGLSIYGGKGADDADYRPEIIRLARDTRWDDFLRARQAARTSGPGTPPAAVTALPADAPTAQTARTPVSKPRRWAVLIGVKDYEDPTIPDLAYTMKDLAAMRNALVNSGYATNRVLLLAGQDATTAKVRSLLGNDLPRLARAEDMITIYFTGHGAAEPSARGDSADGTEKYLLFQDTRKDNLYGTALPMSEMARILGRLPAGKVLVLMDTCYSGAAPYRGAAVDTRALLRSLQPGAGGAGAAPVSDDYLERLAGTEGIVVMTAARAGEVAMESPRLEHGVFTYYLIRALTGEADANQDGLTTVHEAYGFLSENVTREASALGATQRPVMKGEVSGDFPLAWH